MFSGIYLVGGKYTDQQYTGTHQRADRNPPDQVIQDRRQNVYDQHSSHAKGQQALRADPAVQIQKISAVIPPFFSVMCHFQKVRGEIFYHSAHNDCHNKFHYWFLPELIKQKQYQYTAAPIDWQPRPM